ncbi:MAG: hypothetical protein NUV67_02355 [archaeon]|nr:hypothetical protein [archaeon]
MGLLGNLGMSLKIFLIFYFGMVALSGLGVELGRWAFSAVGVIVIFLLSLTYTFYFKL